MSLRGWRVSEGAEQVGQGKADLVERVVEEREDHRPEAGPTAPTSATQQAGQAPHSRPLPLTVHQGEHRLGTAHAVQLRQSSRPARTALRGGSGRPLLLAPRCRRPPLALASAPPCVRAASAPATSLAARPPPPRSTRRVEHALEAQRPPPPQRQDEAASSAQDGASSPSLPSPGVALELTSPSSQTRCILPALRRRPFLVDAVERLQLAFTSGFFPDDDDDDDESAHSDSALRGSSGGDEWVEDLERESAGQLGRNREELEARRGELDVLASVSLQARH